MKKFYFDMDGTIARFYDHPNCLEDMYSAGFFLNLSPYMEMILFVKKTIERFGAENVFILSACIGDICKKEKLEWIKRYLPEILMENIILMDAGTNKADALERTLTSNDILIDDYSKNLIEWATAGGTGMKILNGLNGAGQKWSGIKLNGTRYGADALFRNLLENIEEEVKEIALQRN